MASYLGLGIATVATISLSIQTIAYALLLTGFVFARKKSFQRHGRLMTAATALNFVSLAVVMLPSFYSIVSSVSFTGISSIQSIIILHHSLGVVALAMAAIVVLKSCQWLGEKIGDRIGRLRNYMIPLLIIWSSAYFLGLFVYLMLYVGI